MAVKSTRKKIEQDIQLLKNRVRMLQKEKEKADKKILETKSKAEEIIGKNMGYTCGVYMWVVGRVESDD